MAAVVAVALVYQQWLRPADAFTGGAGWEATLAPDEALVIGLQSPMRTVHVTDTGLSVSGDAVVEIRVVRCRLTSDQQLGSVLGAEVADRCEPQARTVPDDAPEDLRIAAQHLGDAEGRLGSEGRAGDDQLAVVIRPLEEGTVRVEDIRVTHGRGPFHRTESLDVTVDVDIVPAADR